MNRPIISPAELLALARADATLVILDARASQAAYEAGHLRGAQYASLERDLSTAGDAGFDPAQGGRHPLPPVERFAAKVGAWGIGPETNVVIYDDQGGMNAAARAWWMLRAIGHERAAVLDGGFMAAVEAGIPVTTAVRAPVGEREAYPADEWKLPTVDMAGVDVRRVDPSWRVLDVRSAERYRGETEPIDPIAGHIPGAVNIPLTSNLEGGRFRSPDELRRLYEEVITPVGPERLIVHCGSGVTACHTLLALEAAGYKGAALYVGSWSEWCRNKV